jgi:hypothetical protein
MLPRQMTHTYTDNYEDIISSIRGAMTLQDKFRALPSQFKDIIGNINIPFDKGKEIIDAMRDNHGNVLLASDGSYFQHLNIGSHNPKRTIFENWYKTLHTQ